MNLVSHIMAVPAVAVFAVAVSTSVESAANRQASYNLIAPTCDNNARCSITSRAPTLSYRINADDLQQRKRYVSRTTDANGGRTFGMVTVQTAYGFNITVHPAYASKFQKFFALLKERGYNVPANITKCWGPHGTHVAGSNHYIGAACDIQTGWNRGPDFVYHMGDIVKKAGLYNGCSFHDCGHVEAIRGTHNRAPNLYAAIEKFKSEQSTANYQP
jgi:hypothetical protein